MNVNQATQAIKTTLNWTTHDLVGHLGIAYVHCKIDFIKFSSNRTELMRFMVDFFEIQRKCK